MKSQVTNLVYQKRFKAEISNGIGTFMNCLQIQCQLAIMVNAGVCFFTSTIYRDLLVPGASEADKTNILPIAQLTMTQFLILILMIEHVLLLGKIFME